MHTAQARTTKKPSLWCLPHFTVPLAQGCISLPCLSRMWCLEFLGRRPSINQPTFPAFYYTLYITERRVGRGTKPFKIYACLIITPCYVSTTTYLIPAVFYNPIQAQDSLYLPTYRFGSRFSPVSTPPPSYITIDLGTYV